MNNRLIQKEKDDRLADFTDRLLAGEIEQEVVRRAPDQELASLQETLQRVHRAFPPRETDPAMQNRIRGRLANEWHKNQSPGRGEKRKFIPAGRTWSLALAASAILVIVLFVTFLPTDPTSFSGAAGSGSFWIPLVIFLIVIAVLIFWQLRKK